MANNLDTIAIDKNIGNSLDNFPGSEKELVEKAKSDPLSFGKLYDMNYDSVFRYILYRTADIELAKELTSQTFYNALSKIWSFKWKNIPFSAWLIRIASNEVNGHYRKIKNKTNLSIEDNHEYLSNIKEEENYFSNSENLETDDLLKAKLNKMLLQLKPRYQEVIVLRYFEEKPIKEISMILNKNEGTVKSLIHRGLNLLKSRIGAKFYSEVVNG
ncbi:MAG: sigma-70 family RNA polymerase sigma factor [Ignavibacteria bacterium]|jgi:RNA polymerase sigma-70 factor (ECF subfamily)